VIVNVRVVPQALTTSKQVTLIVEALQPSVAVTCALTLATVGNDAVAGLQPKFAPVGTVTSDGAFVSTIHE
jgi:hypothetical protein